MSQEPEFIRRLYALHTHGIKLGLDRTRALLEKLGNPERHFAAIHVAGTNGKGSVCAMLDSILRAAGYRTGLYTSPHLARLNERMRVDGACIGDGDLEELVQFVDKHAQAVCSAHGEVTFFEFTTALAFEHFRRSGARIVVAETGMGGRLDATNVLLPAVSVITPISVEHTAYLGPDIEHIAAEKGGIVKPGRPVVCANMEEAALRVIAGIARERKSRLIMASESVSVQRTGSAEVGQKVRVMSASADYSTLVLPLLGRHQLENCAVAVAAAEELSAASPFLLSADAVKTGLQNVRWPARCEIICTNPTVLLDGAHNPGAAKVLAVAVKELAKNRPVGLVLGMCSDKDHRGFLKPFAKLVKSCWTVTLRNDRALPREELSASARRLGWRVKEAALPDALSEAERWGREESALICVTGSLYLAAEVLAIRNRPSC